ncbi:OmpA family protein [Pararhizobium sp. YC-54]|uniref:OmpA family protein n=1 Tax=Pararhizobium sp. YC-54 TaxID=2986920 RepID=UPI0021F6C747|nr:OmpA family protein [Pararhizobium sp. YC-54]MCV9997243.1 OmpA family protein [Pararhizobium sp. YC-54]
MRYAFFKTLVLSLCLHPVAASAQEVLTTATPDLLIRSLDPVLVQKEKTRGLKITDAKNLELINSYGDKVAATVNLAVNFHFGSAELTPQAQRLLDSVGTALQSSDLASYRFLIGGHTDAAGTDDENLDLSRARAASTTRYLLTHYKIEPRRLVLRAFGETALLFPADPEDGRNRRVEISTLKQ